MPFIPVMAKVIFLAVTTPFFSVIWSVRYHSDMQFKKHFLISMSKTVVLLNILLETVIHVFQSSFDEDKVQ